MYFGSISGNIIAGHSSVVLREAGVGADGRGPLTVRQVALVAVTLEGVDDGIFEAKSVRRTAQRGTMLISQDSACHVYNSIIAQMSSSNCTKAIRDRH
jgi:hypothetical protein